MAEMTIKLQGWHAILAIVLIAGLMGARLMTFQDQLGNAKLMDNLQKQIASDYLPQQAARLQAAMDSGDQQNLSKAARSVTSTDANIESVEISAPLLKFSSPEDVVVKVVYALTQGATVGKSRTLYFLYSYSAVGNVWIYQHQTTASRYYLNFT